MCFCVFLGDIYGVNCKRKVSINNIYTILYNLLNVQIFQKCYIKTAIKSRVNVRSVVIKLFRVMLDIRSGWEYFQ